MDVTLEACSLDCLGNKSHLLGEEGPVDLTVFLMEAKIGSDRLYDFERGISFAWMLLLHGENFPIANSTETVLK